MEYKPVRPNFDSSQIKSFIQLKYGLSGEVMELPSERDQNFLYSTEKNRFVIKISNSEEMIENILLQNQLLNYLKTRSSEIFYPQIILSKDSQEHLTIINPQGIPHILRVVTYISGEVIARYQYKSDSYYFDFGKFLAHLTLDLKDFQSSYATRYLNWDLAHATKVISEYKIYIGHEEELKIINHFLELFNNIALPILSQLKMSVIHGDANDYNVLIQIKNGQNNFGLIDFGDMVYSYSIFELAIGVAYQILNTSDPIPVMIKCLEGYNSVLPIDGPELEILYILISTRLCVSVVMSSFQKIREPDNSYLIISEQPAWNTLKILYELEYLEVLKNLQTSIVDNN